MGYFVAFAIIGLFLHVVGSANVLIDCHPEPNASFEACKARSCQWDITQPMGEPWCYALVETDGPITIDCHPDPLATATNCESRGCTWAESSVPGAPWCFINNTDPGTFPGYDVISLTDGSDNIRASMKRRDTPTMFGSDIDVIGLEVDYFSRSVFKVLIHDNNAERISGKTVPHEHFREYLNGTSKTPTDSFTNSLYEVIVQKSPFGFAVKRRSSGAIVFDTRDTPGFSYADQFLQLTTKPPNGNVFGFGEQTHPSFKHNFNFKLWGMFARDQGVSGTELNLYGVHPFYMGIEDDGSAYGVLLMNSHAQSVIMSPHPAITYRTNGGQFEFMFFMGPTPMDVITSYTETIGRPMMPSYWSLGFHLCRYGYTSLEEVETVLQRNIDAGIPLDTQWVDIDYMEDHYDFTYDNDKFSGMPEFAKKLHQENRRMILILDPCIPDNPVTPYDALTKGLAQDVFIKDSRTGKPLQAKVWPGTCYFPDFTRFSTKAWWRQMLGEFHETVNYDGIWIDMNEPANFGSGSTTGCATNKLNNPPFTPLLDPNILTKTICMDSPQDWGYHYEVHSLYGHSEAIATYQGLESVLPGKKPMVLSRSTFPGSGKFTAHWLGDNNSQWSAMKWSIIGILEFNLFGIPFVGADICGFNGQSNEELCTRWMQLGAFYPFSRNHNAINQQAQDPAAFSQASIDSSKKALGIRYRLLPFLYSLFHKAHTEGVPVARPVFFMDPTDTVALGVDDQFMWGKELMIVPIIEQSSTSRSGYFTKGRWFDYHTFKEVVNPSTGRSVDLTIDQQSIGLFVYGGSVIPWQKESITTDQSRLNNMGLLIALDQSGAANGSLFYDDGESLKTYENGNYVALNIVVAQAVSSTRVAITRTNNGFRGADSLHFDTIQVLGLLKVPVNVKINDQAVTSDSVTYDASSKSLTLSNLDIPVSSYSQNIQAIFWNNM